jgi:hypothetical protein
MDRHRQDRNALQARDLLFARFGLGATAAEPRRVYCLKCGAEIDSVTNQTWGPQIWWQCPRGCNKNIAVH